MSIILCGLPSCGKTTVGKKLANHLGRTFFDTDLLIEETYLEKQGQKLSCKQIALLEGMAMFRSLEKQQITLLPKSANYVIALGGGTLCDCENRKKVSSLGRLIYLKTPAETIWERLQNCEIRSYLDSLNPKESFNKLLKERLPFYDKAADIIIDTQNMDPKHIVESILREINHGG